MQVVGGEMGKPRGGRIYLSLLLLAIALRIGNHGLGLAIGTALGVLEGRGFAHLGAVNHGGLDLGNAVHEALLGYVDAF